MGDSLGPRLVGPAPVFVIILLTAPIVKQYMDHTEKEQPSSRQAEELEDDRQTETDYVRKLAEYGYITENETRVNLRESKNFNAAIAEFQRYSNIPATGVLDLETRQRLTAKRCGFPDIGSATSGFVRYALQGRRWPKTDLTWTIVSHTQRLSRDQVKQELADALSTWSSASALTFTYTNSPRADIVISFKRGAHQDGFDFDGNGQVLAHAFFPGTGRGGDAHFDNDERWVVDEDNRYDTVSLFSVAVHEFGHSLGLAHSSEKQALMYPWYKPFKKGSKLPEDDRLAILKLYGSRRTETNPSIIIQGPSNTGKEPTWEQLKRPPNPCHMQYDAISFIDEELFIFSEQYFWRTNEDTTAETMKSVKINSFWKSLPKKLNKIDAIYQNPNDGKVIMFIGKQFWVFRGTQLESGYPKSLTRMRLPYNLKKIDAAFIWSQNRQPYLFHESTYWRLNANTMRVVRGYPRSIRNWKGVPSNVNAAVQLNTTTYFFRGINYWTYDEKRRSVTSRIPSISAPRWMPGCWTSKRYSRHIT